MSEPKLISPLLDGFVMGDPISDHHGVRCCPAMKKDSDSKYIVKIISIPASQTQLQAFLLTGAYKTEAEADAYFKELSEGVVTEVEALSRLAKLEGFLPYEGYQVVPMDDGTGYDVYLLSPYRRSLERHFRKSTMTHLAAVNLGLDMCASLAVCRHTGLLYTDLKPGNIFISEDNEYRIGDLGFMRLDALKYASLPDKYRSSYTAPENADAMSAINTTLDVYAAGMILYQAYNGGVLPFDGPAPAEPLPAPAYADYEMAEIIAKACAPDPADRWQDPIQMGQALVSYMQRNGANDVPIVPAPVTFPEEAPVSFEDDTPITDDELLSAIDPVLLDGQLSMETAATEDVESGKEAVDSPEDSQDDDGIAVPVVLPPEAESTVAEDSEQPAAEESPVAEEVPTSVEDPAFEEKAEDDAQAAAPVVIPAVLPEDDPANLSFMDSLVSDDTAPSEDMAGEITYAELSDDASDILAQADELIAHETPEPAVAPDPIEIPMPAPITPEPDIEQIISQEIHDMISEEEQKSAEAAAAAQAVAVASEAQEYADNDPDEDEEEEEEERSGGVLNKILVGILIVLILAVLGICGYLFYNNFYLLPVNGITITGVQDELVVEVDTEVKSSLLSVVCEGEHGYTMTVPLSDNKASFSSLSPSTFYTITVKANGLHGVTGDHTGTYQTADPTNVETFSAITGSEDGSVILSFTVTGPEPEEWTVTYSAPGEDEKTEVFSGRSITITGLTLGSTYTFTLNSEEELYLTGTSQIQYGANSLIYPENPKITKYSGGSLTLTWESPAGVNVESWDVRCYNDSGFDKTLTVDTLTATFDGLDSASAYKIEINAKGMFVKSSCEVTANAVTVSNPKVKQEGSNQLNVTWDYEGPTPAGKWLLVYTVDDCTTEQSVMSSTNSATVSPIVPDATYNFSIQLEDGSTVFDGTFTADTAKASRFEGYTVTASHMAFKMCKTPSKSNWTKDDLKNSDYTSTFKVGKSGSFLVRLSKTYATSPNNIYTMYVIRDAEGKLVSFDSTSGTWTSMWLKGYCELDVPQLPSEAGEYTVAIYFNGNYVHQQKFTMEAAE